MLETILRQYNPEVALEEASLIPVSWYLDPSFYQLEMNAVFKQGWQFVGLSNKVKELSSYLTTELAGESLLISRDKQGKLRAFSNICRHKANFVVESECGKADFFQCRYHGWTYDSSGQLKGTPEFQGVQKFEKEKNGLASFQVEEWGPFLFVNLGEKGESLERFLSPLQTESPDLNLQSLKWVASKTYPVNCNWKVYVDNYLDGGYHINTVHPKLAKSLDYTNYRAEIFGETVLQHSPLKANSTDPLGVRSGNRAYYWWLMPNLMINAYEGVMDVNWVLPEGPDRCRVVFDFFFADTESASAKKFIQESLQVADEVQREDEAVCENVQKGLRSKFYQPGRFSVKRENGNHYFHQLLASKVWKEFKKG